MLAEMTAEDYHGWQEYFAIHGGLGPEQEWQWRGLLISTIINAAPFRSEKAEAIFPEQIYPWLKAFETPPPEPTPEQAMQETKRMQWKMKIAAWKTGNVFMPSVRPPSGSLSPPPGG